VVALAWRSNTLDASFASVTIRKRREGAGGAPRPRQRVCGRFLA